MNRLAIVGTTGSGKSTLAGQVAQKLALPYVELDAIQWQQPDWTPITTEELQAQVAEKVCQERWVIEGGYSVVRPLIWARADTIIWLDYPFQVTFARVLRRTLRRIVTQEPLWGGNRETLRKTLSRDSILWWCIQTHGRNRRKFRAEFARPEYKHLRVLHFQSPRDTEMWLLGLPSVPVPVVSERKR